MTPVPKSDLVDDKKYRDSFKKMHTHTCFITRQQFTELSSHSVTACHITIGRYGRNIRDDKLILPLRQDLHMDFDKRQPEFLIKYFDQFPQERRDRAIDVLMVDDKYEGRFSVVDVVKQLAIDYYEEWKYNNP